jgi:hypothetical protein
LGVAQDRLHLGRDAHLYYKGAKNSEILLGDPNRPEVLAQRNGVRAGRPGAGPWFYVGQRNEFSRAYGSIFPPSQV